jgi:hypothetical protein
VGGPDLSQITFANNVEARIPITWALSRAQCASALPIR